ncbi:hypothetical protein ACJMJ7_003866 [Citrobacter freundii]
MKPLMPPIDTPDKLFHDGNPATGEEGTIVPAEHLNNEQASIRDVQSEMIAILTAAAMAPDSTAGQLLAALNKLYAPGNDTLGALASLVGAANKLPYFTGPKGAALTDLTAFARTLLSRSDAAGVLSDLDLGDVLHAGKNLYEIAEKGAAHQASARDNLALNAIAAIVGSTNKLPYFVDINTAELADFTAFARTLLSRTDASAVRGDLGLKSAALRDVGVGANQIPDVSFFANSLYQNGFMKLPGGLMLQWGLGVGVNGTASVTFNQAFVNRPFFVGFGYKQSTFPSAMQSIIINDEFFDNTAFSARTLMFDGTTMAASPNAFLWYALGV